MAGTCSRRISVKKQKPEKQTAGKTPAVLLYRIKNRSDSDKQIILQ